jgi:hypothetical protein
MHRQQELSVARTGVEHRDNHQHVDQPEHNGNGPRYYANRRDERAGCRRIILDL